MSSGYGSKTYGANAKALRTGGIQPGVLMHHATHDKCDYQDDEYIKGLLRVSMEVVAKATVLDIESLANDPLVAADVIRNFLGLANMVICGAVTGSIMQRVYVSGTGPRCRFYLWQEYASARSKTHIHVDNANLLSSAS
jgi:hypothetical protein